MHILQHNYCNTVIDCPESFLTGNNGIFIPWTHPLFIVIFVFFLGYDGKEAFQKPGRRSFWKLGVAVQEETDGLHWQEQQYEEEQVVW